ncbi:LLM class flavin-dependent oxidoreductase [SAR86 cluster bacterium]|jgi:luciferase family oxidoreductase group 1|nr:LLM class flavin-dependent oxidoreductase [SAR86 cluster bacterium]
MKISVVDQSPIFSNSSADQAIKDTRELAKYCDSLGLNRFWLAEHHGSSSFAGCSPEILIPSLASETESIRIGSGGVMLMHYSPYKVAENFRLLESLFPNRIDLGLGRAPGSDAYQAGALAYGSKTTGPEFFPTKMNDLKSFLEGSVSSTKSFESVNVTPGLGELPEVWLLVSSRQGAEYAAHFGLPMALAYFIDPSCIDLADVYRDNFQPSIFADKPKISVGVFSICADTDKEAEELSLSAAAWRLNSQKGIFGTFPTLEEAKDSINGDLARTNDNRTFVGTAQTIREKLQPILNKVEPEELKIITICEPFSARVRSYDLIKQSFALN